ncbi:F-box/LRR-repeat protein [Rosa sericea]
MAEPSHKGGYNLRKRRKTCALVDRISGMPDEILVSILSFLPLKEAQATCVLSRRWHYVWASLMTLNFDTKKRLSTLKGLKPKERDQGLIKRYAKWVDSVVEQHRAPRIDQFRVSFYLDKSFSSSIDKWVEFALKKGVQMLELNLLEYVYYCKIKPGYPFPQQLLGLNREGEESAWKHLCRGGPSHQPCVCVGLKSLRVLTLECVDISGDVLEYFLRSCPVLERVSVYGSSTLVYLRVVGPSIALKHLVIQRCSNVVGIEIVDADVVSFTYDGGEGIHLRLENVPHLVEVSIYEHREYYSFLSIDVLFASLSSCVSQLEILKMNNTILYYRESYMVPMLPNLKLLGLSFKDDEALMQLASFLKASPCVERLVIHLHYSISNRKKCHFKNKKAAKCSHADLKTVKLVGYDGSTREDEIVKYLTKTAINLEQIVIDPARNWLYRIPKRKDAMRREEQVRAHFRQLKVPSTIDFVCL